MAASALTHAASARQSSRREAAIRNAVADAAAFHALRCAKCGTADLFAVDPGSDPEGFADLFVVTRPAPVRAWCAACWPASFAVARAA